MLVTVWDELDRTVGQRLATAVRTDGLRASVTAETRALLSSTTAGAFLVRPDAAQQPATSQQRHVRDLLQVVPAESSRVAYVREVSPQLNEAAAATAEGGVKPEQTVGVTALEAYLRKLAAWVPITSEVVDDAPGLAQYVDGRLARVVLERSDALILNGTEDPGDPALTGWRGLNVEPGTGTGEPSQPNVRTAVTTALSYVGRRGGVPSGVVVSWQDWKAAQDQDSRFWESLGVPYVATRHQPVGLVLAGDFDAAVLREREELTVRIGDQHADYLTSGRLAVVAEVRQVLTITAPQLFATASVTP